MLADTAPADVPTMIGNGQSGRGWISAIALRTPTWNAARAPPPVRISPARETLAPLLISLPRIPTHIHGVTHARTSKDSGHRPGRGRHKCMRPGAGCVTRGGHRRAGLQTTGPEG